MGAPWLCGAGAFSSFYRGFAERGLKGAAADLAEDAGTGADGGARETLARVLEDAGCVPVLAGAFKAPGSTSLGLGVSRSWQGAVFGEGGDGFQREALQEFVVALANAKSGGRPLLPIRVHYFFRNVPGVWSVPRSRMSGGERSVPFRKTARWQTLPGAQDKVRVRFTHLGPALLPRPAATCSSEVTRPPTGKSRRLVLVPRPAEPGGTSRCRDRAKAPVTMRSTGRREMTQTIRIGYAPSAADNTGSASTGQPVPGPGAGGCRVTGTRGLVVYRPAACE